MKKYFLLDLENIGPVSEAGFIAVFNRKHIRRTMTEVELFLVTDGTLELEQGNQVFHLKKGSVFISENSIPFGGKRKSKCSFFFLHIDPPNIKVIEEEQIKEYQNKDRYVLLPQSFKVEEYLSLVTLFNEIASAKKSNLDPIIISYLLKALLKSIEYFYNKSNSQKTTKNTLISEIIAYYYFSPDTAELNSIEKVAKYFHYDKQYLARLFKRETGIKMNEFLIEVKIRKAKEALISNDKNISEIAKMFGYRPDYFQKLFKNKTGLTPLEYRKAYSIGENSQLNNAHKLIDTIVSGNNK